MIKELKNEYPGVDFKELRKLTYDFGMINVAFSKTSNIELSESDSIKIMAILSKFGVSEKAFNVASGLNYLTVSHDMQDSSTQLDILSVNAFLMHFINRLKNERSVFYANDRLPLDCVDDMAEQSKYTPDQINKLCAAYHNAHAINALIKYIDSPVFLKCNKAIEHFNRARIYGCSDAENNIRAVELYRDISDEAESKKRTDEIYNIFSEKITALKPVIKDISTKSLDNIFRRFFVRVS
ncbi:MAG: hypothetical protein JHC93_02940 [Parachlamydiales bacterium]|nr:hypothetical protein [Parachlamydiales bacterium]